MGSVNFSVPDDVKDEFNATFRRQNKSAIIADLMHEAIERARNEKRSQRAAARIIYRHRSAPLVTVKTLRNARKHGRA